MHPLMLHRACDLGPIRAITASIEPTETGFEAQFRIEGRIDRIRLPEAGPTMRADDLWKTTCFEVFWQPVGSSSYREFNFSPSGRWAAYDFDAYRTGRRDADLDAIAITCSLGETDGEGALMLKASVAADLEAPAQTGLSTVIEHADGALQYWAMAFAPGKPDFHSEACRQLIIER